MIQSEKMCPVASPLIMQSPWSAQIGMVAAAPLGPSTPTDCAWQACIARHCTGHFRPLEYIGKCLCIQTFLNMESNNTAGLGYLLTSASSWVASSQDVFPIQFLKDKVPMSQGWLPGTNKF